MPVIDYKIDLRSNAGIPWPWENLNGSYIAPLGTIVDVVMGVERWEKQIEERYDKYAIELTDIRYEFIDTSRLRVLNKSYSKPDSSSIDRRVSGISDKEYVKNNLTIIFEFAGYDPFIREVRLLPLSLPIGIPNITASYMQSQINTIALTRVFSGVTIFRTFSTIFGLELKSIAGIYSIPTISIEDVVTIEP